MDSPEKEVQVKFTVLVPLSDLELLKSRFPRQVGPMIREFIRAQAARLRQQKEQHNG